MHDDNEAATPAVPPVVGRLLVTAVSHGVRTPLHSLLGFLELLGTSDLNEEARGLLSEARGGGDELLAASDRLLMLLRLLAGDPMNAPQPFSPADLLHEIAMAAGPKGAIWVDANPYLPTSLDGNVEFIRQLVFELASNAVRHGAQQTRIYAERVTGFAQTPVRVRFTVSDDGPGLPADALRRLTASHGRFDEDPNQVGLFLARRLAAHLDTELVVAQSDERGTTITFEVSLLDPATGGLAPAPAAPTQPAPGALPRALHVLLVEDNSVNRILAQRQMARLGHRLDTVTDGTAGVRAVLAGDYDVVLMDRHLPDIDGVESTRRIREGELAMVPPRHTPIIAVTADASPGHRQECQAAGMDGFLTKPLDLEHLRVALLSVTAAPEPDRATGPRRAATEPDIDASTLDQLRRSLAGDSNAVADLMRTYIDELPARRMRLQAALGRSEPRQAAAAAETLWTSSGAVGALRLAELCEQIHHAARTGDLERGRALLPDLRETCDRAASALKEYLPAARP